MSDLMQDVAGNLQQRIGQLVSQYEADMAILRANAAKQLSDKDVEIAEARAELESVKAELEASKAAPEGQDVQAEDTGTTAATDAAA